jgi:hypothetical protein
MKTRHRDLLAFDEVSDRLRMDKLRAAFPHGEFPAISAFEIGGVYFVSDGHHRVALAHERGQAFIDAEIVRLLTNHQLTPKTDIPQLIHTELRRLLMEESGLDQVRPDIDLSFSNPAGYLELVDYIKSYGWDLAVQLEQLPARARVAAEWLDAIYDPGMEAIDSAGLDFTPAELTQGDLFLWLYRRRQPLCASGGACGFSQTVREALDPPRQVSARAPSGVAPPSCCSPEVMDATRSSRRSSAQPALNCGDHGTGGEAVAVVQGGECPGEEELIRQAYASELRERAEL